jgi:hypothetical protein
MTSERDYVLRMVREFATFLARIVRSKEEGQVERTIADIDQTARTYVGLGLDALEALPIEQLTIMLSIGGSLDVNRAYATGRLLAERADVAARVGSDDLAASLRAKALRLLADAALAFGEYLNEEHRGAIHRAAERHLAASALVEPRLVCALFDTYVRLEEGSVVVRLADAFAQRLDEPVDRMAAVRLASHGRCPSVVGRVAEVVEDVTRAGTSSNAQSDASRLE